MKFILQSSPTPYPNLNFRSTNYQSATCRYYSIIMDWCFEYACYSRRVMLIAGLWMLKGHIQARPLPWYYCRFLLSLWAIGARLCQAFTCIEKVCLYNSPYLTITSLGTVLADSPETSRCYLLPLLQLLLGQSKAQSSTFDKVLIH